MFKALASAGIVLILAMAGFYGSQNYIKAQAESDFLKIIEHYQEQGLSYRRFNHKNHTLYLYGVSLDPDGFHTIEKLSLSYDPWVLWRKGRYKSLSITKPSISMHSDDLQKPLPFTLPPLKLENIIIEDAEISFLTPELGTYIFQTNVTMQNIGHQVFELSGQYESMQPHIRLSGAIKGKISETQESYVDLALDGLEIEKPGSGLTLKRSNGKIHVKLNPSNIFASDLSLELTSGHAVLFGFPWANSNFSLSYNGSSLNFLVNGKAPSDPNTEFTYSYGHNMPEQQTGGVIYSSTGKSFYTYLNRNNLFILNPDDQPKIYEMDTVEIPFEIYPKKRQFIYYLDGDEENDKLKREVFY